MKKLEKAAEKQKNINPRKFDTHRDPKSVRDTLQTKHVSTHRIWES